MECDLTKFSVTACFYKNDLINLIHAFNNLETVSLDIVQRTSYELAAIMVISYHRLQHVIR